MILVYLAYIFAVIVTAEQAFDVISTNLVISKGRGTEGDQLWGFMRWWQGQTGWWWWTIKLPVVAYVWWFAVYAAGTRFAVAFMVVTALVYAYVLYNNYYKVAWRHG